MENVKPSKITGFVAICLAILAFISIIFPKNGIFLYTEPNERDSTIKDTIKLKFPHWKSFLTLDTTHYANIDNILNHKIDSNLLKELNSVEDSLEAFRKISMDNPARIHYPKNNKKVLHSLFEAFENAEEEGGSFRILHYGDSQIEMDRITSYIREQLQSKFGGSGPGLQPAVQVIDNVSIRQSTSGNFVRYASWGFNKDEKASHGRYGIMLNFAELDGNGGTISFSTGYKPYPLAEKINNIKVLVGSLESTLSVSLYADGKKYPTRTASPGVDVQLLEWDLDSFPQRISVSFSGGGTPEIYGIALDGTTGVSVDNMPMRGCSGTIFKKTSAGMLKKSYELMNVKLLILEFGGNMMPSINGPKTAESYGERFAEQIKYLKAQKPDMDIIVIGPADMSKRINGSMQSYPYLTDCIEALKKAAFESGGAYWDTYQVMGGHNSMPTWVSEGLAGKDYIHFSTKGAQKISELFVEALLNDYNEYRLEKRIEELNGPNPVINVPVVNDQPDTSTVQDKPNDGKNNNNSKPSKTKTVIKKIGKSLKVPKQLAPEGTDWITYTVKLGDTLWKISEKFKVPVEYIISNNGIVNDKIIEGQVLKIKKAGLGPK